MIICGTGHRPKKLGGYGAHIQKRLVALAEAALVKYQPERVISGMALGWDQALAQAAVNLGIPFLAAVPFKGQEGQWPQSSQDYYFQLIAKAGELVIVSEDGYSPEKMQLRNELMVNNATHVLALWSGARGGTHNCIVYAKSQDKPIINLWRSWERHK